MVVGIVVASPPVPGGRVGGTEEAPISRIDRPLPHTLATSAGRGDGGHGPGATAALGGGHPFTAPAVRPRMSWRWKMMSTITMGTEAITVPAVTRFSWSGLALASDFRPIWTVR